MQGERKQKLMSQLLRELLRGADCRIFTSKSEEERERFLDLAESMVINVEGRDYDLLEYFADDAYAWPAMVCTDIDDIYVIAAVIHPDLGRVRWVELYKYNKSARELPRIHIEDIDELLESETDELVRQKLEMIVKALDP